MIRVLTRVSGYLKKIGEIIMRSLPFVPIEVLVYQMGKVGSSTIYATLKNSGIRSMQVHQLLPENLDKTAKIRGVKARDDRYCRAVSKVLKGRRRQVRIITLVREPISQNYSAYFQNFARLSGNSMDTADSWKLDVDVVVENYLSNYVNMAATHFFDKEFGPVTGIDVYSFPFPHELGYQIIKEGPISVLILRVDTPDGIKTAAINEFLGTSIPELVKSNVSEEKLYAKLYADFKTRLQLPQGTVDCFLNCRYTRHFFTSEERRKLAERWTEET